MFVLITIAIFETLLLAGVIWSTRRKPAQARIFVRRRDDIPHAL
jgi:hypothetical protein